MQKRFAITVSLILLAASHYAFATDAIAENNNSICAQYEWQDIIDLVEPYLDETLHTALIMQGNSQNYDVSQAAHEARHNDLPNEIQGILFAIATAKCPVYNNDIN